MRCHCVQACRQFIEGRQVATRNLAIVSTFFMNYSELTKAISKRTGIPESDIRLVFSGLLQVAEDAINVLEPINIENIGRLEFRAYKPKLTVNNKMKEWITKDVQKQGYYHGFFKLAQNVQAKIHNKTAGVDQKNIFKATGKAKQILADKKTVFD